MTRVRAAAGSDRGRTSTLVAILDCAGTADVQLSCAECPSPQRQDDHGVATCLSERWERRDPALEKSPIDAVAGRGRRVGDLPRLEQVVEGNRGPSPVLLQVVPDLVLRTARGGNVGHLHPMAEESWPPCPATSITTWQGAYPQEHPRQPGCTARCGSRRARHTVRAAGPLPAVPLTA